MCYNFNALLDISQRVKVCTKAFFQLNLLRGQLSLFKFKLHGYTAIFSPSLCYGNIFHHINANCFSG